jgi:hypothetical protein
MRVLMSLQKKGASVMQTRRQHLAGLASVGGLVATAGCSSSPGGGEGHGSISVTYKPGTRVLSRSDGERMILGVTRNGSGVLLDGQNEVAKALKDGDVLFVKELLARKVLAVGPYEDGNIIALTEPAELTEIVDNAKISVSKPVRFDVGGVAAGDPLQRLAEFIMPRAEAQTIEQSRLEGAAVQGTKDARNTVLSGLKDAIFEDWKVTCTPTLAKGKMYLDLKMTRDIAGLRCVITGDGYLQNFDYSCDIGIEKSTYQKLQTGLKNLNGVMNFAWEASTETPGAHTGDYRFKLPAAIQIPLYKMLDGFPLFLEISSAFIIKPAFSGGEEFSRGAFRITYDGYQNFSAKEGNIDAAGEVTGGIQFAKGRNISTLAPLGMVVGFAVPRIELTFGFNKILTFGDLKAAASKVDAATDWLAKKVLSDDQYARLKSSPFGSLKISTAIDNAIKSDASAYLEFVTTVGMSNTGMSVLTPCTRHDIHLLAKVGVSAEVFGQKLGEAEKEVYKKDFTRVEPSEAHLCQFNGT